MLENIIFTALFLVVLFMLISVIAGVPYVPTHTKQAMLMMDLAGIGPNTTMIDLGSGDGKLLYMAAKRGATAVGYELNPFLVWYTRLASLARGLHKLITVKGESIYTADVRDADVVVCFLMEKPMARLEPKLFAEMKPGSKIISYVFPFPHHEYVKKEQGLFVYTV